MTNPAKITKILRLIEKAYGRRPAFRRTDPVDELVRTILSQNTNDRNSLAAFAALKRRFRRWDELIGDTSQLIRGATQREVSLLIKHAGLANIKAKRIKDVLAEIKRREGRISLARLGKMRTGEALAYLESLKGVGPKTAACVLLFSFGKPVMPVDTHIFRVAKRLGLIGDTSQLSGNESQKWDVSPINIEGAHSALTAIVPKRLIYRFHLGIIEHGRRTCKAVKPHCGSCNLYRLCRFEDKVKYNFKVT